MQMQTEETALLIKGGAKSSILAHSSPLNIEDQRSELERMMVWTGTASKKRGRMENREFRALVMSAVDMRQVDVI